LAAHRSESPATRRRTREIDETARETLRLPQDVAEKIGQMMQ